MATNLTVKTNTDQVEFLLCNILYYCSITWINSMLIVVWRGIMPIIFTRTAWLQKAREDCFRIGNQFTAFISVRSIFLFRARYFEMDQIESDVEDEVTPMQKARKDGYDCYWIYYYISFQTKNILIIIIYLYSRSHYINHYTRFLICKIISSLRLLWYNI